MVFSNHCSSPVKSLEIWLERSHARSKKITFNTIKCILHSDQNSFMRKQKSFASFSRRNPKSIYCCVLLGQFCNVWHEHQRCPAARGYTHNADTWTFLLLGGCPFDGARGHFSCWKLCWDKYCIWAAVEPNNAKFSVLSQQNKNNDNTTTTSVGRVVGAVSII
jgi:hypothetical protein